MRARNREINIFNMSLLDILTGMLGAFLFLMLGLLPYYAKVSKNNPEDVKQLKEENKMLHDQVERQQQQIADLQKQLEELQKIVKQAAGGPLTAEQIQQLMDELNKMRQQLDDLRGQIQQLQAQNSQLQNQLTQAQQQLQQAKQDLDDMTKEKNFWMSQQGTASIVTSWDSAATDIDVLVMAPDGTIYSPKSNDKVLGRDAILDGDDSHSSSAPYNHEGVLAYLTKSGDYLVFYRVPKGANPATYASLSGNIFYSECLGKGKGIAIREDSLGASRAYMAAPGGLYAWATITYNSLKSSIRVKPPTGKMPPGILLPEQSPQPVATPTPPVFPFTSPPPRPTAPVVPVR